MKCTRCGSEMIDGFTGVYCPKDCDRIPQVDGDDAATLPYGVARAWPLDNIRQLGDEACCKAPDIEPFELHGSMVKHCVTCGKVML